MRCVEKINNNDDVYGRSNCGISVRVHFERVFIFRLQMQLNSRSLGLSFLLTKLWAWIWNRRVKNLQVLWVMKSWFSIQISMLNSNCLLPSRRCHNRQCLKRASNASNYSHIWILIDAVCVVHLQRLLSFPSTTNLHWFSSSFLWSLKWFFPKWFSIGIKSRSGFSSLLYSLLQFISLVITSSRYFW